MTCSTSETPRPPYSAGQPKPIQLARPSSCTHSRRSSKSSCSSPGPPRPRTTANRPSRRSVSHARASARKRSCSAVKRRSIGRRGTLSLMEPKGTAVVTGASRGIGRAVVIELAARGFDTIATMRDPADGKDLEGIAPGRIQVARLDVTDPSSISLPDGLRVLVNNAGVESDNLPLEHMPLESWERLFATNVFGLVEVTKHAVPIMRAAGGGVICNVTSSSTLAPVPFLGTYRASKAAVTALGESLAAEVAQFGIRVIEIMPGPIETDMLANSDQPPVAAEHAEYRDLANRLWEGRQGIRDAYTPAAEAARRIVDAICADDGPIRYGCDDLSEGMLQGWNDTNNAQWVRGMLKSFS